MKKMITGLVILVIVLSVIQSVAVVCVIYFAWNHFIVPQFHMKPISLAVAVAIYGILGFIVTIIESIIHVKSD